MKKISIVIPCYNEESNVEPIAKAIINRFETTLAGYDYEIIFIDNASKDSTRLILRNMCGQNLRIKAIFNIRNFGQNNSPYHALLQAAGDCAVLMSCDFQDPVELIDDFVHEWENGYKIVTAIKSGSTESKFMYLCRSIYYKLYKKMSSIEPIEHFTGFGLYDKSFIQLLKELRDPIPFLRGTVAEFASNRKDVYFVQPDRRSGKSHNNFKTLYSIAMRSFTSYTKLGIRAMSLISFVSSIVLFITFSTVFVFRVLRNDSVIFTPALISLLIISFECIQLFFIGLLGEYIFSINERIMNRPLVVEEERLNF